MKRNLLCMLTLLLSVVTGYAQEGTPGSSKETALDLPFGKESVEIVYENGPSTETVTRYYKYKAEDNCLLELSVDNQNWSLNANTYVNREDDSSVGYAFFPYPKQYYLIKAGELVYVKMQVRPYDAVDSWTLAFEANLFSGDNLPGFGKGETEDNPMDIVPGKMQVIGANASSGETAYTVFKAEETGILKIKMSSSFSVELNGEYLETSYEDNMNVAKVAVEADNTYNINFKSLYNFGLISPEFYVPQLGSDDKPYEMVEGVNTVPAEAGKYWYKVTPSEICYMVTSSEDAIPVLEGDYGMKEGRLSLYTSVTGYSIENADYGSFNLNYELKDLKTYYYCVNKPIATDEPQSFNFAFVSIKDGDVFAKPLTAQLGDNEISEAGTDGMGTKFYTYTAAKDGRMIVTFVPKDAETSQAELTYPLTVEEWNSWPASKDGLKSVLLVDEGDVVTIKLDKVVDGDKFIVEEADYELGDTDMNPIEIEGSEYEFGSGTIAERWYRYTVKSDCYLRFKATSPQESNWNNSVGIGLIDEYGDYTLNTDIFNWNTNMYETKMVAAAGQQFMIKVSFVTDAAGVKFTFEEGEIPHGLSIDDPIVLDDNVSEVSFEKVNDISTAIWMKAALNQGDKLTLSSNVYTGTYTYVGYDNASSDVDGMYNYIYPEEFITVEAETSADYYVMVYYTSDNATVQVAIERDPTSAINEVNANADFNLNGNVLTVGGNAKVYSLDGAMVGEISNNSSLSLNKGVYLINVNGTVKKVMVK